LNGYTESLDIEILDDVPGDVAASCTEWITEICTWLLEQPRQASADTTQPRFTEIKFTVSGDAFNHGLRNTNTGRGYVVLAVSNDLKIQTRPNLVTVVTDTETACRGNWCYILNQVFRPDGFAQDSFKWEEHLTYQLRYLDFLAEDSRAVRSQLDDY
jgi:hypothetical protein